MTQARGVYGRRYYNQQLRNPFLPRDDNNNPFVPRDDNNNHDEYIEEIFTIIVKTNRYACKKLAVTSSEVIREFIKNNPDSKEYNFEFDGSIDNFDIIRDFFNFKPIKITKKNADSIRPIAETLKIAIILSKIESFTETFETKIQQITPIEEVFNWLYQIQNLTVESVKKLIIESKWSQSEENVKELVSFILQVVRSGFRLQPYLIELIISLNESSNDKNNLSILLPFIIKQMLNFFNKNQFYCCFTYKLVQKGILSIDEVIQKVNTLIQIDEKEKKANNNKTWGRNWESNKSDTKSSTWDNWKESRFVNILIWFYPELIENNLFDIKQRFYLPEKESIDIYKKMRDSCEPENNILKALFNDDVDTLQSIISKGNFNINNFKPPFEFLDLNTFHINKSLGLIDYSALYGSIKCFKYLLLNHAHLDCNTLCFAIFGGNVEIIRTIDQQFEANNYNYSYIINTNTKKSTWGQCSSYPLPVPYNIFDNNLTGPLGLTIILHQYDLFDWIVDTKITFDLLESDILDELAYLSALTGNVHSFIFCIDNGFKISEAYQKLIENTSKNGYFTLTKFIASYKNKAEFNPDSIDSIVLFGNISIFKLFVQNKQIEYRCLLRTAIENHYNDIVQFILDNNLVIEEPKSVLDLFSLAIQFNTFDIFEIIENKYNFTSLKNSIDIFEWDSLCLSSCKNYKIACKLIDFIINNFKDYELTHLFLESFNSGSEEICSYLLDKMKFINLSKIIEQYHQLFATNATLSLNLLNKFNDELKESLTRILFNESIKLKNKKVFDLYKQDNLDNKMILIAAVKFRDIELVKKVLSYKNDPSFVNQIFSEGTALTIATSNGDIEIVKYLLEIPGIDVNIADFDCHTSFIIAITQLNIDMIEIFVDFYGNEIQSQTWQLRQSISLICFKYFCKEASMKEEIADKIIFVLKKLIQIDENLNLNETDILFYAIAKNALKIVEFLLKIDSINVNKRNLGNMPLNYTIQNKQSLGSTPLIYAILNKQTQIAKLLINHPKIDINAAIFNTHTAFSLSVLHNMDEIVNMIMNHPKFDPESSNLNLAFFISTNDSITNLCYSIKSLDVNYQISPLISKPNQTNENEKFSYYDGNSKSKQKSHYYGSKNPTDYDLSLIDTSLTFAVKSNQLQKVDLIINHPSFNKTKSRIIQALFLSVNNAEIFKVLFKLVNDPNIISQDGKTLFKYLFCLHKTNLIKILIKDSNLNLSKEDLLNYYKQTIEQILKNDHSASEMLSCIIEYDQNHNHFIGISDSYEDALQNLIAFSE